MLKKYKWHGHTWQISEEDLHLYPGAELIEVKKTEDKPEDKAVKKAPANKSRKAETK